MLYFLLSFFAAAVLVQLFYIVAIFSRTAFYKSRVLPAGEPITEVVSNQPKAGVSIVVCAWNELENLRELLPLLEQQNYPTFEIIVMNDRSTDGTRVFLEEAALEFEHLRFYHIDQDYDHVTPKKYALTTGIRKASYNIILVTDADCRPASDEWLAGMVAHLADPTKEIVLGFSPYQKRPGWLNRLIRYETLYTAVQYFSLALAGQPYMGVGRNLMYRRDLFLANKGFYSHMRVIGGDDDLFMNEVATSKNVAVCLHPATFVESIPKETVAAWRYQKRRHLSVGKYYKLKNKLWLGILSFSHIMSWLTSIPVLIVAGFAWVRWEETIINEPTGQLIIGAVGLFLLRLLLFWVVVGKISYRLGKTVHWLAIPAMDLILSIYYASMGILTLWPWRNRKIMWR